jgi:23S rRNA (cytidine1920-2'-O)/16S rRNA (cytidine1409-2'-O)-methyltransferase
VQETVDFVAVDVSFISATLVLPAVLQAVFQSPPDAGPGGHGCELVVLVKPQFEAGREHVGKGGIVRDAAAQAGAVEKVRRAVAQLGAGGTDVIESPILGGEGNREFLLYARWESSVDFLAPGGR